MKCLISVLLFFAATTCFANTIIVGKGKAISSLKLAIKTSKNGDTILLNAGTYKEGTIIIDKSIHLIGVNTPILDGENKNEILTVTGKNIFISGIHFANAGYSSMNDYAGLKIIDATNIKVEKNIFSNTSFAIHISNSTHCTISNNSIKGTSKSEHSSGNGIHLWKCSQMLIENNTIQGHRDGIYFEFVSHSTIRKNWSEKNIRYGLHFMFSSDNSYLSNTFRNNGAGVAVMYSKKVIMLRNHFDQNWGASAYGILLKDITDSRIQYNTFFKNTIAIHMEGSSRIQVEKNIFKENGWGIKVQSSCDDNNFRFNNFYGNSFDLATNGTMMLNYFSNNYWDKYEGYDINKDGTGDIPFHPVSMYSMIVEQNPHALLLMRSFTISLLDKAEKAIPGLTPENLVDNYPKMKPNKL
ncbi:nitrous oxide reductase [Chitinophagaceae bacterium IBVUCB2]|nr:nitrous oxide reductase [Chitinophagaceae bacterium IBVUCB2]